MDFWSLTDDELVAGITIMHDSSLVRYFNHIEHNILMAFLYDTSIQKLTMMWLDCNCDKTLMKIRYHEEIRMADQDEWTMRSKFMPSDTKYNVI